MSLLQKERTHYSWLLQIKEHKNGATKENEKRPENTGKVSVVEDDQSEGELY